LSLGEDTSELAMPTIYQTTNLIGPGNQIRLASGMDLVVATGVFVASENANGVVGNGSNHGVQVFGTVGGDLVGVDLGSDPGTSADNTLRVMEGGSVFGGRFGVHLAGSLSTVQNNGVISANDVGVAFVGNGDRSVLLNTGQIQADFGVQVLRGAVDVFNFGRIVALETAISTSSFDDMVENRGEIIGLVDLGAGDDWLDNGRGSIEGDVRAGGGNDFIDLLSGSVSGSVYGEAGNDMVRPGSQSEFIDGGTGTDTLDFRDSAGVQISLADGTGAGPAAGDAYLNFEVVLGSFDFADGILGDSRGNTLRGFGGDDVLSGRAGNDVLEGGLGADTLTGGTGSDSFRYLSAAQGRDTIRDFRSLNDDILISAEGFGGGLEAGQTLAATQFEIRPDNHAQNTDVRFVFRTTDQTLWFDVDGSASRGPVLIADFQVGAVLTNQDILLI
jgi:Ca2+-binding RTX toxin-like protein